MSEKIDEYISLPLKFRPTGRRITERTDEILLTLASCGSRQTDKLIGNWIAETLNDRARLEAENARLKSQNEHLDKQLAHVNKIPNIDGARHCGQLMQVAARLAKTKPGEADFVKIAVDSLKSYDSQKEKERMNLEAENDRLREALNKVAHLITNHMVYEKDARAIILKALEGEG